VAWNATKNPSYLMSGNMTVTAQRHK